MGWLSKKSKLDTDDTRSKFFFESPTEPSNGAVTVRDEPATRNGSAEQSIADEEVNEVEEVEEETELHSAEAALEKEFQQIKSDVHRQVISQIDLSLIGAMPERGATPPLR